MVTRIVLSKEKRTSISIPCGFFLLDGLPMSRARVYPLAGTAGVFGFGISARQGDLPSRFKAVELRS